MKGIITEFGFKNGGLSQTELSKITGIALSTLNYANSNSVEKLSAKTIISIAKGLGVSAGSVLDDLLEIEKELKKGE